MKVKIDFVTNSSSCSYLVFIPDNFDINKYINLINKDRVAELIEQSWGDIQYQNEEEVINAVKEKINDLIKYGTLWQDENIYYLIGNLLEQLDLVIDEPETGGGDGSGAMMNIAHKPVREKLKNILSGGWGIKHGGWGIETKI